MKYKTGNTVETPRSYSLYKKYVSIFEIAKSYPCDELG